MDFLAYKRLEWDIKTFRDNTQTIAETLANTTAELGSMQNIPTDDYAEIYNLTCITDELAKSIVDSLTELSAHEEENTSSSWTNWMVGRIVYNEKALEEEFKPAFEHFQRLHRQVVDREIVTINSLRNSLAQSTTELDQQHYTVHISPEVVSEAFGSSEVRVDRLPDDQTQLLNQSNSNHFMLEMVRERNADLRRLESQALELHEIETKLSVLTKKHEEKIENVEQNVEQTEKYAADGAEQLLSATEKKKKSSRRTCICILIALAVLLVLGGLVAIAIIFKL